VQRLDGNHIPVFPHQFQGMGNYIHLLQPPVKPAAPGKRHSKPHTAPKKANLSFREDSTPNVHRIHEVACFGEFYCLIADKSRLFDYWSSECVITFYSADTAQEFPQTALPEARLFLGAYVDYINRRIVAANLKYVEPCGKAVNIYIYKVNCDYTCSLTHTLTNDASDCASSCFMGRLTSIRTDESMRVQDIFKTLEDAQESTASTKITAVLKKIYVLSPIFANELAFHKSDFTLIYNDVANNPHTTVFRVILNADSSVDSSVTVIQNSQFPPVLNDLTSVYFSEACSFSMATAKRIEGRAQTISLQVCRVTVKGDKAFGKILVDKHVNLHCPVAAATREELRVLIEAIQCVEVQGETTLRCLVRVELCEPGENSTKVVAILVDLFTQHVLEVTLLDGLYALAFMAPDCDRIIQCEGLLR
jgi:hypothetical protein